MDYNKTLPDVYTTYLDNQIGSVTPTLANVEGMVGSAKTGVPGFVYSFSGKTALDDAILVFTSGDLLNSIADAFRCGASKIYAVRAGVADRASIELNNTSDLAAMKIEGKYSTLGNADTVEIVRTEAYSTVTLTATIVDKATEPDIEYEYVVSGAEDEVVDLLVIAINTAAVFKATALAGSALSLKTASATAMTGGTDGTPLINSDYVTALAALETKDDINFIHGVKANTSSLWALILGHCSKMYSDYQSECWALLETPIFVTTYDEGTAGYIADRQTYVDSIVALADLVADKNACIIAGSTYSLDPDGTVGTVAVSPVGAIAGVVAGLDVQQSLINKKVPTVQSLYPEFTPGQMETLIAARVNFVRLKEGRGYVIGHSLTAAAAGSDYSRVNDLRAVYKAAKEVRKAVDPFVGEGNDSEGETLRVMVETGKLPLEIMETNKQIDEFELTAENIVGTLRKQVKVKMGIMPMSGIEIIYHNVYIYTD